MFESDGWKVAAFVGYLRRELKTSKKYRKFKFWLEVGTNSNPKWQEKSLPILNTGRDYARCFHELPLCNGDLILV